MKIDFRALRAFGAALLLGTGALSATGCSEDEVAPPPPRYAPITVFHAVTDYTGNAIQFKIGETVLTSSATYGNPVAVSGALVGTGTTVTAVSTSGTALGSANVNIDTNRSVWVIAAGEALSAKSAVFGVTHLEPTVPSGAILLRAIHASNNAPKIDVRQDNALGSKLATGIEYKQAGDFISINAATTKISVTNATDGTELLLFTIDTPLTVGKIYNLVIYGSADQAATGDSRLTAKILQEPA